MKKGGVNILGCILICSIWIGLTGCDRRNHSCHGVNEMQESELMALYDRGSYDEIYIVNSEGEEVAHYVLVDKADTAKYDFPEGAVEIRVPLEGLVVDSEVYGAALEELGQAGIIRAMFDGAYVTSPAIMDKIKSGSIADLGPSTSPDQEKILTLDPEAIMLSYFDGMQAKEIDKLGIPVIKMYDLQEASPLGRAEWIRLIGRLAGEGDRADSIFESVTEKYHQLAGESGKSDNIRPKILTDTMYEGVWNVAGGKSYQAALIRDAGGNYFKNDDNSAVTLNLSAEQVLTEGGDADIWLIKHYGDEDQLKMIIESDPVYKEIKAYKEGKVYFSDTSRSGLFREFPFHPENLLNDYRIIFSGDTVSTPRYFRILRF